MLAMLMIALFWVTVSLMNSARVTREEAEACRESDAWFGE